MNWRYLSKKVPETRSELQKILLQNRGIENERQFFNPKNPKDITLKEVELDVDAVKLAVNRIHKAVKDQQRVIIFGDYDADGISATAIVWEALKNIGLVAQPFIPHREKHGYGISHKAIDDILEKEKPHLIITVDNGIVAHEPLKRLAELKIDVIVTDHHQPEATLPEAYSIVHTTRLCGATVAWMLVREFDPVFSENLLDLAAIGTISDLVPLLGANRSFAHFGLKKMSENTRVGIGSLLLAAGLDKKPIESDLIGYGIGPRINAMGRLSHGLDALRLLVTKNSTQAQELSSILDTTNTQRQSMTYDLLKMAKTEAKNWKNEHLIFLHSTEYHEGVIGLIAGRLTEEYAKPVIVVSVGEKTAKASARSVVGVNIIDLIRQVKDDLLEAGGHPMAAGFGVLPEKIEGVKNRLLQLAKETIDVSFLEHTLDIDCAVPYELVTEELIEEFEKFAPFGQKNPRPLICLKNVEIIKVTPLGKESRHLKIIIQSGSENNQEKEITCLFWNRGSDFDKFTIGQEINIAGELQINEWNGWRNVQLIVKDIK